jgi:hypothetical protein
VQRPVAEVAQLVMELVVVVVAEVAQLVVVVVVVVVAPALPRPLGLPRVGLETAWWVLCEDRVSTTWTYLGGGSSPGRGPAPPAVTLPPVGRTVRTTGRVRGCCMANAGTGARRSQGMVAAPVVVCLPLVARYLEVVWQRVARTALRLAAPL